MKDTHDISKSALIGEAASKVRIFEVDGINYSKAWDVLERSYEVRRVLISRHLSSILNTLGLEKETSSGLSRLADDTQQHVAALNTLGVSVGQEMVVHILETKLSKNTLEKWETTLDRDSFPTRCTNSCIRLRFAPRNAKKLSR